MFVFEKLDMINNRVVYLSSIFVLYTYLNTTQLDLFTLIATPTYIHAHSF